MRNSIAQDLFDKDWVDINGLQRKKITRATASGLNPQDIEDLTELDELVSSQRVLRGEEEDLIVEKYHSKQQKIQDEWMANVSTGIDHLSAGPEAIDLG